MSGRADQAPRTSWPQRRVVLAGGLVAVVVAYLAVVPGHRGYFDLGVYHGAIHHWLREGGQLYEYLHPPTYLGFTYPPFAALFLSPLALAGWYPAVVISIAVNVGAAALVLFWLVDPIARRQGWVRWFVLVVALCAAFVLEPMKDTLSFGQVNLVLLALVLADVRRLPHGRGLVGVGIGLAAAIKLTPGLFIVYLLVSGARRAAGVAAATAVGATLLAAAVAPRISMVYWTGALWDTDRMGRLGYVSNQSLRGVLARIDPDLSGWFWLAAVAAVLVVWAIRVRRAARAGDWLTGFALTGVAACLISPITWVHHLVWLLPAMVLLADAGLRSPPGGRRLRLLGGAALAYALLCSSVVWLWVFDPGGVDGLLGSNGYVWLSLVLLFTLPARSSGADLARPVR